RVTRMDCSGGDLAGVTTEIECRADYVLHRETHLRRHFLVFNGYGFQVIEQACALVPTGARTASDYIVTIECADRNEVELAELEVAGEGGELFADAVQDVLAEIDQVHFVDRDHHVRDVEQRGDEGVAARLRENTL